MRNPFSSPVQSAAIIAECAGKMIAGRHWSTDITSKQHAEFGTASVANADSRAEEWIIQKLLQLVPGALFVGEESAKNLEPSALLAAPRAFIIDPRDGTTEDSHELPFWSVSIGVMERGVRIGGAVFAPEMRGGLLIASEEGAGVYLAEHGSSPRPVNQAVNVAKGAKPIIHLGLDVLRSSKYLRFLGALPKDLKPRGISASGALGLALVAAGRIDAIVQSPQMPWDLAAGLPMVIERDLAVYAYRIENDIPVQVTVDDPENFRTDKQTLGVIAGKPELVEPLAELFIANFGG